MGVSWYPAAIITVTLLLFVYMYLPNMKQTEDVNLIKYILLWTNPNSAPLSFLRHGHEAFLSNGCQHVNCFVSHTVSDLGAVYLFDAIVFNGRELPNMHQWPQYRSLMQKYVYANMESPQNHPACEGRLNDFFNWTWTYKLDSDLRWGYISVYDLAGQVVGPKIDMHWQEMDPIDDRLKARLVSKNVAAAWFVSNCKSKSKREEFVENSTIAMNQYGLSLDIYGKCGRHSCPRGKQECDRVLEDKYYFYFALENSLSEDYVTEKVLKAFKHFTVPVVFGGANYSRFLPPGSYLDGRELGPQRLAARIAAIVENHKKGDGSLYHDFFRWRNHYTFQEPAEREDICNICRLLNDPVAVSKTSVYGNFLKWWNGKGSKCSEHKKEEFDDVEWIY